MSDNILFISVDILKERSVVHDNVDPKLIYPDIKYAQDEYIEPVLGTALFNKMQQIIGDGTIATLPDYKLLMDKYIVDAMIYYVMSMLPLNTSYQFWNKGMIRKQSADVELPSMSDMVEVSNNYKSRAERYANRMKLFLLDQSSRLGKYPEYVQPGSTVDTIVPHHKQFTSSVYLGDDYDNPWCNKGGFNGQPYKP